MSEHTPSPDHRWRTVLQQSTWEVGQTAVVTRTDGTEVYAEVEHVEPWGDTGANLVEFRAQDPMDLGDGAPTVPPGERVPGLLDGLNLDDDDARPTEG